MDNFADYFKSIDNDKKIQFLKSILSDDSKLRAKFLDFVQKMDIEIDDLENTIDEVVDNITNSILMINAEDYYCDMSDYNYWQDGDLGNDILDEIMKPYLYKIEQLFNDGKFKEGFAIFLALYEICISEEISGDDEIFFGSIEDFTYNLISEYKDRFFSMVKGISVNDNNFFQIVDLIFLRVDKNEEYDPIFFSEIFEILVTTKDRADYLFEKIKAFDFDDSQIDKILVLIAKESGDSELELHYLEKFFMNDEELTLKLLQKYVELKMHDKFYDLSERLLNMSEQFYVDKFIEVILKHIDKERYFDTFIKALKKDVKLNSSFKSYEELKRYLSFDERMEFVDSEIKCADAYLEILNYEKEYEKILYFMKNNENVYYDFFKAIDYVLKVYPKETFEVAIKRCDRLIEARGRENYETIVSILKVLKKENELKDFLEEYIGKIYRHKPTLPALRDVLKKSHLI